MSIALVCPEEAAPLQLEEASGYRCPSCGERYALERGVVRFLPKADAFYEGRYANTIRFVPRSESAAFAWPLWLVNSGWVWSIRRHVPAGATLVEMGCGSGVAYFAQRYDVIGLDLSFASLAAVADLYDACLQADATRAIPLPDASVDAIASSYVWEHIPPERKPALLAECARVLRPGGKLVFLYDLENDHPLYRRMREADPALYHQALIEGDGHLGWQRLEENRAIFEASGFAVREHVGREKLLLSPAVYDKVARWGGGLARIARIGLAFRSGPLFHPYNAGLRVFDATLGRALPDSWARIAITVCQKPA